MNLQQLGATVRERRIELGLNQTQIAAMSGLSRTTVNLLENGSINDIGFAKMANLLSVLGIELQTSNIEQKKCNSLLMASRSSSVSYLETISAEELSNALTTGVVPHNKVPHIATLVDELPVALIVSAVEEAANDSNVAPKKIWGHINRWAIDFQSPRSIWK
ncbi:MAG: helix-turn-helix domain-containing protein [Limnohabitans sp.]